MAKKRKSPFQRSGQFHRVYRDMFESDAYRSLCCVERCLLHELQALYLPSRNDVFLSVRDAAFRLGVHKDTASKAFYVLEKTGFIRLTRGQLWQQKLSREWRLTFEPYKDREPTDNWRLFKKPDVGPNSRDKVSQSKGQNDFKMIPKGDE